MNKEELWNAYKAKNPNFGENVQITLTGAGIKKLFDQTWDKAESHGFTNGREYESRLNGSNSNNPFGEEIFNQMFGGKFSK